MDITTSSMITFSCSTTDICTIVRKEDTLRTINVPRAMALKTLIYDVCGLMEGNTHQSKSTKMTVNYATARMLSMFMHVLDDSKVAKSKLVHALPPRHEST